MPRYLIVTQRLLTEAHEIEAQTRDEAELKVLQMYLQQQVNESQVTVVAVVEKRDPS